MNQKGKGDNLAVAREPLGKLLWRARYIYILLIPGIAYYLIFCYAPMGGILMAFQDYKARLGLLGSPFVGLANFDRLFITPRAVDAIINTLRISFGGIVFTMPVPIALALLINEMKTPRLKKTYQTIYTFPHFLSWIIISTILINLLSTDGAVNSLLIALGAKRVPFLSSTGLARPMLYITGCWKEMGWNTIVYLAVIAGIDPALYEAATIDGANRTQRIRYITFPAMRELFIVMFILSIGGVMNSNFDQVFTMRNNVTQLAVDTIDVYVYDITFGSTPSYSFSTAVGLFKAVINFALLFMADRVAKLVSGQGMFK